MNVEHAKGVLAKQAVRLKPNSLGHRIRFVRSFFHYAYEEMYLLQNPHRFRHPYACQLLDKGDPLDFIQGMLGYEKHRSLKSTHNSEANIGENSIDDSFSLYWRRISL
jgi:site-specific recombinase XerD